MRIETVIKPTCFISTYTYVCTIHYEENTFLFRGAFDSEVDGNIEDIIYTAVMGNFKWLLESVKNNFNSENKNKFICANCDTVMSNFSDICSECTRT